MAFMGAMGAGEMDKLSALMANVMVCHNEGDKTLPWIDETDGKQAIFAFHGMLSENFKTTMRENTDAVAVFGKMNGITTNSGKETGSFSFALHSIAALFQQFFLKTGSLNRMMPSAP